MSLNRLYASVAAGALTASLAATGAAIAADSPVPQSASPSADYAQIETVVVTAEKRTEKLSEVPAAVTAISASQLETSGVSTIRDLVGFVPGLQVSSSIGSGAFVMRGINTGVDTTPAVGTQIDGAPLGGSTADSAGTFMLPLIDPSTIARVEVLRGPQGTVYAGNTLGGIVNYVTTKPNLSQLDDSFYVEGSGTENGGGNGIVRGMITAPIVEDNLAFQLSGFVNRQSGFIDATADGRKDYNYNHAWGGRAALLWQVSPDLEVMLSDIYSDVDSYSDQVIGNTATNRPIGPDLTDAAAVLPHYSNKYNVVLLNADLDLHWATLSYVGTYQHNNGNYVFDISRGAAASTLIQFVPLFGGVPLPANAPLGVNSPTAMVKTTQEVRLSSPDSGRIRWLVGAVYDYESDHLGSNVSLFAPDQSVPAGPTSDLALHAIPTHLTEVAGFGDVDFYVTPKLDVTGGIRVSHITQDFQQFNGGSDFAAENALFAFLGYAPTPAVTPLSHDERTVESYLANVRYQFTPETMAYFRFATGFRVGGPNSVAPGLPTSYGPDQTKNYEIGVKSSFLEGRGYVELTAFNVDWSNIQVSTLSAAGTVGQINGGGAYSRGVELNVTLKPVEGLSLAGSLAYDDAKLTDSIITGLGTTGLAGDNLPNSPRWAGSFSAEYEQPITGDYSGFVSGQLRYSGARGLVPQSSTVYPVYEFPAYTLIDLRAGIRFDDYEAAIFVRNVGDSRAELGGFPYGVPFVIMQRPRTIGVSLSGKF